MPALSCPLGLHHMAGGSETGRLLGLSPSLAVCADDWGALVAAGPLTVTMGREDDLGQLAGQGFDMNRYVAQGVRPEAAAALFVAWLTRRIRTNPWIKLWIGPNEQVFIHDDQKEYGYTDPAGVFHLPVPGLHDTLQALRERTMAWYADFSYEFARLLSVFTDASGAPMPRWAGIGAWPTGVPLERHALWPWWVRALDASVQFGAVQCWHEYAGAGPDGRVRPDRVNDQFVALGYTQVQHAITECGSDSISGVPNSGAWRTYYGGDFDRYWTELLEPFSRAIERANRAAGRALIIGAAVFSDGGAKWKDYDVSGTSIVARISSWLATPPVKHQLVDISKYQERQQNDGTRRVTINFDRVKAAGIDGVIIKLADGTGLDPCAVEHVQRAIAAGMLWGVYHYYRTRPSAETQASVLWQILQSVTSVFPPLGVYADIEEDPPVLTGAPLADHTNRYLARLDALTHYQTSVYSRASYLDHYYPPAVQLGWRTRPLWVADYSTDLRPALIPAGWKGMAIPYVLLQTRTDLVPGIDLPVDMDETYPDQPISNLYARPLAGAPQKGTDVAIITRITVADASPELVSQLNALEVALDQDLSSGVIGNYTPAGQTPGPAPAWWQGLAPHFVALPRADLGSPAAGLVSLDIYDSLDVRKSTRPVAPNSYLLDVYQILLAPDGQALFRVTDNKLVTKPDLYVRAGDTRAVS